jgi:hypothetical protein
MLILEITLKFLFIFQLALAAPLDYQEYLSVRKIINEENDKQNDDLPDYSLKEIIKCLNWVFGIGGGAFSIVVCSLGVIFKCLRTTSRTIDDLRLNFGYVNNYVSDQIIRSEESSMNEDQSEEIFNENAHKSIFEAINLLQKHNDRLDKTSFAVNRDKITKTKSIAKKVSSKELSTAASNQE